MKIYTASSWRNQDYPQVVEALRTAGHEVFDFRHPPNGTEGFHWREIDPQWQQWGITEFKQALQHPIAQHGYHTDLEGMQWAECGVLVMPCGRSAHLEAGYFVGTGKPLHILMSADTEPELMYNLATSINGQIADLLKALSQEEAL